MNITRIAIAVGMAVTVPLAAQAQITLTQGALGQVADPTGSGRIAQLEFLGGYGNLNLSNGEYDQTGDPMAVSGGTGFLAVIGANTVGNDGSNVFQTRVPDPFGGSDVLVDTRWQSPSVNTMSLNTDGQGSFDTLALVGGLQVSGTRLSGTLTGGTVAFSNVRVDLTNHQIIADVSGTRSATSVKPEASFGQVGVPVWTFASVAGPTVIKAASLLSTDPVSALTTDGFTVVQYTATPIYQTTGCFSGGSGLGYPGGSGGYWYPCTQQVGVSNYVVARGDLSLGGLQMTPEAMNLISNSLGLQATGSSALVAVNAADAAQWGDMHVGVFFRTGELTGATGWPAIPGAIPEPSTYALMGLGLVGIAAVARRRVVATA